MKMCFVKSLTKMMWISYGLFVYHSFSFSRTTVSIKVRYHFLHLLLMAMDVTIF